MDATRKTDSKTSKIGTFIPADIMVCALAAVFLMMATGCLPLREAYRALQSNVLMLITGTIALGMAMDKTGAGQYYADLFLRTMDGWSPNLILGGVILLTSISTQLLSNNATAVLLLPIAISTALGLGVNPQAVHYGRLLRRQRLFRHPHRLPDQNLLVYGPGGVSFQRLPEVGDSFESVGVLFWHLADSRFLAVVALCNPRQRRPHEQRGE
jgi:di/tricarboxylate transporter